jgi:hypothetical protein
MSNVFNAFDYLYFNPELSTAFNIQTIEGATVFYNNNIILPLAKNMSVIPINFNTDVFFSSSRDVANVASLSRVIYASMSNAGLTASQISRKQHYVPNIFQHVVYEGSNIFRLIGSNAVTFTSNNILSGDYVRIIDDKAMFYELQVGTISPSNFAMSNSIALVYPGSNYLLQGILATDPARIAKINYARLVEGYSNISIGGVLEGANAGFAASNFVRSNVDSNFDPTLYKILYPDARILSDNDSYIDWVNKRKNEIYRIRNVYDIAFGGGNQYVDINLLRINSNIDFRGVIVDGIQTYLDPNNINVPGNSNKLITENAIKNYTDVRMASLQNLGSFTNISITDSVVINQRATMSNYLYVLGSSFFNSNATFSNNVNIEGSIFLKSNLDVTGSTTLRNSMILTNGQATFSNNVIVNGSMSVTGNMYNPRIGLGYMPGFLTSNNGTNIIQAQNYNDNSDIRIKKNVLNVSRIECLNIIKQLQLKRYQYNYGKQDTDEVEYTGLIAQDVEAIDNRYVYKTEGYLPDVGQYGEVNGDRLLVDANLHPGKLKILLGHDQHDAYVTIQRKLERGVYEISPSMPPHTECYIYGYHTDALKNVNYKELFVVAIGAIQELSAMLDQSSASRVL